MNKHTAALLEKHFDTAFAAPNGIAKLRELILTLAMQGKLVKQDPNDQSASELLKEIEAEKQRLIKEGKIKKQKPLPEITADEIPYELPSGWEWVRLLDVADINGGFAFKSSQYTPAGTRVIRISDFDESGFKNDKIVRHPYSDDLSGFVLEENNILMAMTGGTVGKSLFVRHIPEKMIVNQCVATIRVVKVFPEYINSLVQSQLTQKVIQQAKNSTNDNISMSDISSLMVPLPPLSEQHRIVTKIDELMARCDMLEQLRAEQEQKRLNVHQAVIQQLLNEPESNAWGFIQQHFNELYSVKANVEELRKAILQLAVMGRLVPNKEEIEVKCLQDLTTKIGSGSTPPGGKSAYKESGIPLIRSMNVHFEGFKYEGLAFIDDKQAERLKGVYIFEKDVLLNITGASIGRVTLAPKDMEGARVNQHVCILRTTEKILPEYLQIYLASPLIQNLIQDIQTGATREALTKTMIEKFEIRLPSLQAQIAAITKVDELMALCNQLEAQIDLATSKQTELLDAVLASV